MQESGHLNRIKDNGFQRTECARLCCHLLRLFPLQPQRKKMLVLLKGQANKENLKPQQNKTKTTTKTKQKGISQHKILKYRQIRL